METMHVQKDTVINAIAETWKADIRNISERDYLALPIHTDMPRMARKMTVEYDRKVVSGADSVEARGALIVVVSALSEAIYGKQSITPMRDAIEREVKEGMDYGQGFLRFLQTTTFEDARLTYTFKLLHQKIIFPAYYYVKYCLGPSVEIRDVKGSWNIHVAFPHNDPNDGDQTMAGPSTRLSSSNEDDPPPCDPRNGVIVTHVRSQRSAKFATDSGEPEFEFEWELRLETDKNFTSLEVIEVSIREPRFHPAMDKKEQQSILKSLRNNGVVKSPTKNLSRRVSDLMIKALK